MAPLLNATYHAPAVIVCRIMFVGSWLIRLLVLIALCFGCLGKWFCGLASSITETGSGLESISRSSEQSRSCREREIHSIWYSTQYTAVVDFQSSYFHDLLLLWCHAFDALWLLWECFGLWVCLVFTTSFYRSSSETSVKYCKFYIEYRVRVEYVCKLNYYTLIKCDR